MILEVFSKKTLERVGMIKTCKFAQYVDKFCGVGSFSLKVPTTEESLKYLDKNHFILFDEGIMGIIRYRKKATGSESTVEIKGYLISKMLEYRSFLKTKSFKGTVSSIARDMVDFFFINNEDYRRRIPLIKLSSDLQYFPDSPQSSIQSTGKTVGYVIESLLDSFGYGYSLVPVIANAEVNSEYTVNLSEFTFRVHKPTDRTIGNTEGNTPVEFSVRMNNLEGSTYIEDDTDYCSTAVVAGEGEGSARTIVEVGDTESSGWDRIELYVDARDLQSVTEDTVLSEEEYTEVLSNRGYSHLEDHTSLYSFNGTVIDGASSYVYGRDFFNGDYVSVVDEELGIIASVQISSVTKSMTESGEKLDITFGKERVSVQKIIRKRGII